MKIRGYACDNCRAIGELETGQRYPTGWIVTRVTQQDEGALMTVATRDVACAIVAVPRSLRDLETVEPAAVDGECEGQERLDVG